jgi:hypothetical protein
MYKQGSRDEAVVVGRTLFLRTRAIAPLTDGSSIPGWHESRRCSPFQQPQLAGSRDRLTA